MSIDKNINENNIGTLMSIYITNNPLVVEKAFDYEISHVEAKGVAEVLTAVRDLVHKGHKLQSHPLSGSVKPSETPYKTVVLSKTAGELCLNSLRIIEDSIIMAEKMENNSKRRQYSQAALKDFQLIDYGLIFGKP